MPIFLPDPTGSLFEFQEALESLRASGWLGSSPSGAGSFPPINVFRKGDDFVLLTELPGIKKSELDIQVKANTVRIAGSKTVTYPEKAGLHRRERPVGRFDRVLTLPIEIDADRTKAEYRDGMLAVFLPRAEHDKPRLVKVS
jgi:HSP20 family protein